MRTKLKLALLLSIVTILLSVFCIPTQVSASQKVIQTVKLKPGEAKKLKVPSHYTNNTNETMYLQPRAYLSGWGHAGGNMVSVTSSPATLKLLPGDGGAFSYTVKFAQKVKPGKYLLELSVYEIGGGVLSEFTIEFIVESSEPSILKIFNDDPHNQKLYVYQSSQGTYGYVDKNRKIIIPAKFQTAKPFNAKGAARVSINGKYGFINKKGAYLIKPQFDEIDDAGFHEGMVGVRISKNWGFVNEKGTVVVKPKYAGIFFYSEGLAPVYLHNGKVGFIDKKGTMVIPAIYSSVTGFSNGQAIVYKNGKAYYINKKGKVIKEAKDILKWEYDE
ncbi:WG repeat-containing protein [Paenibacillus pabuli]|uniref:WG repeat-containing protein n=1 Tax=Paenibacillus pabuli TaxID=1472 RepID=UPI0020001BF4|nr:WG repeat-containing protein [Paenibacillus pabuli]UPK41176.1 WG repeat-containing protein [Paenibacillus pabuli]